MTNTNTILENEERIIFSLRELYSKYGYIKYRLSKFEEYDLYARNKDFLVSKNIITFTDGDGKLMALKPDITLSIIKNSRDEEGAVEKMYYNENVYRASSVTKSFKEIMQVGLEAIGDIDDYCICEVVLLAAKSLECIKEDYILDISHMGVVSEVIDSLSISEKGRNALLKALGEKNLQGLEVVCREEGISEAEEGFLKKLCVLYGTPKDVISALKAEALSDRLKTAVAQLEKIAAVLEANGCGEKIKLDFSVLNDINYYNGVVFKGYVNGVPESVLSGGQYDSLMKKMSRKCGAVGFAVYTDLLDRIYFDEKDFDVDAVLLYDEDADPMNVSAAVSALSEEGLSVVAQKSIPKKIRFEKLFKLCGTEVENVGYNA